MPFYASLKDLIFISTMIAIVDILDGMEGCSISPASTDIVETFSGEIRSVMDV